MFGFSSAAAAPPSCVVLLPGVTVVGSLPHPGQTFRAKARIPAGWATAAPGASCPPWRRRLGKIGALGCVQQLAGGRLVTVESLWLGSSFISATLPAVYPLLSVSFGVYGVADVCVLRLVVVLRGCLRLETNHCSSSRVSVSAFDGAAPSSLGEGKGSPSMLEEAGVGSSPAPGFQPLSSTPLPVADP